MACPRKLLNQGLRSDDSISHIQFEKVTGGPPGKLYKVKTGSVTPEKIEKSYSSPQLL